MAAAPLTSNHVNYLIWRYLQESGHDKAAARLQRDWKIGDPETLPFARHIQTHALVSLVQKGLQFHELESSLHQNGDRATQTPTALFFGTDSADAVPARDANQQSLPANRASSPRKHARESIVLESAAQAPAPKRPRRTKDGAAANPPAKSGDEMDIDQQQTPADDHELNTDADSERQQRDRSLPNGKTEHSDLAAGVSPSDAHSTAAPVIPTPSPPPVPTLQLGQSVPTQTDGIVQVSKDLTHLLQTEPSKEALLTAWNPHQPNVLISGGDGLCRLFQWPVPFGGAQATNGSTVAGLPSAPHTHDLFNNMKDASITALAWSPDGQQVAIARHVYGSPIASCISLFDNTGTAEGELSQSQQYFLGLEYSPSGEYLLGYGGANTHYEDGSRDWCLCVWDASDTQSAEPMSMQTASRQEISGAAWLDDTSIIVCGPGFVAETKLVDSKLQDWQTVPQAQAAGEVEAQLDWSMVAADKYSGSCILCAGDQGRLAILSPDRRRMTIRTAHQKLITGLQYQPLPQHGSTGQGPRLLASASEDGSIKLWDTSKELSLIKVLHCDSVQTENHPVLAMQFSPDGSTLAAASFNRVVFWRTEREGAWPSAMWELSAEMGWRSLGRPPSDPMGNGEPQAKMNGVANGVNGHASHNGSNGTDVSETVQTDRMSVDGEEGHGEFGNDEDDDDETPATTLLWSAMGKKIAFGSRNQIAVADFTKAQMQ